MLFAFVMQKTGLTHLVQVGLTAGRQAGRRKPCCFRKILKVIALLLMRFSNISIDFRTSSHCSNSLMASL